MEQGCGSGNLIFPFPQPFPVTEKVPCTRSFRGMVTEIHEDFHIFDTNFGYIGENETIRKGIHMTRKDRKNAGSGRFAWKRYGAVFMAGVFLAGTAAAGGLLSGPDTVMAEEEERITLNVVDDEDESAEDATEAESENSGSGDAQDADSEDSADTDSEDEEDADSEESAEDETEESDKDKKDAAKDDAEYKAIGSVETGDAQVVATDVSAIVENCMPAVVSVTNSSVESLDSYYGVDGYEMEDGASGIIIAQNEKELLVATSSDIIADSNDLEVTFHAGSEDSENEAVAARVKGMDRTYGLAVIAVQLSDIPEDTYEQIKVAAVGMSDELKAGQAVIVLSSEAGYGQRVSSGIVSAVDCSIQPGNPDAEFFMTDAGLDYGSGGAAVFNTKGELIGIGTDMGMEEISWGAGYAVPIDAAAPILENLSNKETRDRLEDSERGYLGATVVNVSDDAKELYNMPEGAFVYEVEEDSAADKAGIQKGDIITKFDGESVTGSTDLIEKISYYGVGETVTIEVQTANNGGYESREAEVTLQEGSEEAISQDDNF